MRVMPRSLSIFLVVFLLLALYASSLGGEPLWDDNYFIFWKYQFRSPPSFSSVWKIHLWPLFDTVVIFFYKWWANTAVYWKLLNLTLHALNAWLIATAVGKWKPRFYWPVLVLFLIHPLNVMSVAFIIQLKTLLCTMFFLLAAASWLKWDQKNKVAYLILSVILFSASITSKASSLTFPFIAVMGFLIFNQMTLKRALSLIPFLILTGLFLYRLAIDDGIQERVSYAQENALNERMIPPLVETKPVELVSPPQTTAIKPTPSEAPPKTETKPVLPEVMPLESSVPVLEAEKPISKTSLIISNFGQYFVYPFSPWPLSLSHGRFTGKWPVRSTIGLSLFIILLGFFSWKKKQTEIFLLLAQFFSVIPFLGFVFAPYMTYTAVSEQHLYMMLPFSLSLQLLWWDKLPRLWKRPVLTFVILGLMLITLDYAPSYKSEETLFRRVLEENPRDMFAHVNLAGYYKRIGHNGRALMILRLAVQKAQKDPLLKRDPSYSTVEHALKLYELE